MEKGSQIQAVLWMLPERKNKDDSYGDWGDAQSIKRLSCKHEDSR